MKSSRLQSAGSDPAGPSEPVPPSEPAPTPTPSPEPVPGYDPGPPVRTVDLPPNSPSPGIPVDNPEQPPPIRP